MMNVESQIYQCLVSIDLFLSYPITLRQSCSYLYTFEAACLRVYRYLHGDFILQLNSRELFPELSVAIPDSHDSKSTALIAY